MNRTNERLTIVVMEAPVNLRFEYLSDNFLFLDDERD